MRVPRFAAPALAAALVLGSIAAPSSTSAGPAAKPAPARSAAVSAPAPFARVYLALRGCTSCSHCRTTIRQMTKGSAKGGEARVAGDQVEVLYAKPRVVPLREVIRSLADNRLHDLSVVDVLFEAKGAVAKGADGALAFTMAETGQAFPIRFAEHVERPADGSPVRLVAVVDGWRGTSGLTLVAREVHAGT
ncbi:MAG TPA: hypothetical protein VFT32_03860 [Candidatus Eisenbacteria bacterium]|nr:hypothetical protein [Candidatus Eisenbacteria bacterium]